VKEEPAKEPEPQMIPVKQIREQGDVVLVEWLDEEQRYHRASVPKKALSRGECDLNAGIPYGEAWERAHLPAVDPVQVANELRRHGIWTADDLLRGSTSVRAALQRLYVVPALKVLIQEAKK